MSRANVVILAFALLVAVASSSPISEVIAPLAKNESHHLVIGNRQYGDQSIYQEKIAEKFLISGQKLILVRNIRAPVGYTITQVRCLDQATDGTGAEATVTGGGPEFDWVDLRFKSQRWHGIYFNVEVYAKRRY